MNRKNWLDTEAMAKAAGMRPSDFRARVSRGHAPAPDFRDEDTPPARRRPLWKPETAAAYLKAREARRQRGRQT
jgi:hypothetical protein